MPLRVARTTMASQYRALTGPTPLPETAALIRSLGIESLASSIKFTVRRPGDQR